MSNRRSNHNPRRHRPRVPFSTEEDQAIRDGLRQYRHAHQKWVLIKAHFPVLFHHRTPTDLSNRNRNIRRSQVRNVQNRGRHPIRINRRAVHNPRRHRGRITFSRQEDQAILRGLQQYGHEYNRWTRIKGHYPDLFRHRSPTDLSNRYRNLERIGNVPMMMAALEENQEANGAAVEPAEVVVIDA